MNNNNNNNNNNNILIKGAKCLKRWIQKKKKIYSNSFKKVHTYKKQRKGKLIYLISIKECEKI